MNFFCASGRSIGNKMSFKILSDEEVKEWENSVEKWWKSLNMNTKSDIKRMCESYLNNKDPDFVEKQRKENCKHKYLTLEKNFTYSCWCGKTFDKLLEGSKVTAIMGIEADLKDYTFIDLEGNISEKGKISFTTSGKIQKREKKKINGR